MLTEPYLFFDDGILENRVLPGSALLRFYYGFYVDFRSFWHDEKSMVLINNVCIILSKCEEHRRGQTQNGEGGGLIMRDTAKVVMMALLMASVSLAGCFGEEAKEEDEIPVVEEVFGAYSVVAPIDTRHQCIPRQIPPKRDIS